MGNELGGAADDEHRHDEERHEPHDALVLVDERAVEQGLQERGERGLGCRHDQHAEERKREHAAIGLHEAQQPHVKLETRDCWHVANNSKKAAGRRLLRTRRYRNRYWAEANTARCGAGRAAKVGDPVNTP